MGGGSANEALLKGRSVAVLVLSLGLAEVKYILRIVSRSLAKERVSTRGTVCSQEIDSSHRRRLGLVL